MPELHKLTLVEVDLNLELFPVPTKSGPQCLTTLEQVPTMPTRAHLRERNPAVASRYQAPAGLDSPQPGLTVPPGSPTTA